MKIYARITRGIVVELLATDGDVTAMFHPDLQWVQASDTAGIACGWSYDGKHFEPPFPVAIPPAPTILAEP